MFTGLVEDVGTVRGLKIGSTNAVLKVETSLRDIKIGDSVAVNGACLTVTEVNSSTVSFDVSRETLNRTNLKLLKTGDKVNLERALTPQSRLGGHIVQGHVDTTGIVEYLLPKGEHYLLRIRFDTRYGVYVVEKGSIAVDGISLTINNCGDNFVEINVIPHTYKQTNLKFRRIGDLVNLEFDILGKYVVNYLERTEKKNSILREFLNG